MNENKKDSIKKIDDLNFVPLNIKEPLKLLNNDLLHLTSSETIQLKTNYDFLLMGLPHLNLNNFTELPELKIPESIIPQMKYPDNIPNLTQEDLISPKTLDNTPESILEEQLQYPSETGSDELYSYNQINDDNKIKNGYNYEPINPVDILRNFDLLDDFDSDSRSGYSQNEIESIFKSIIDDNTSIMAIMKAYRVPYPIAKLLIKKIVKLTLNYSKR